jgi:predicted amidophosphoribosyltransferase
MKTIFSHTARLWPPPFLCYGCKLPTWNGICTECRQTIRYIHSVLPSPTSELVAIAPIQYAFQSTYSLLRNWKEKPGTLLKNILFQLSPKLKAELLARHFQFVVPIPQSQARSWQRGQKSAEVVARYFASELNLPLYHLLELKDTDIPRQATLQIWERSFAPNPFQLSSKSATAFFGQKRARILLVDDLITSGNTLGKAAEIIHVALPGAKIYGASLGYRPRMSGTSA